MKEKIKTPIKQSDKDIIIATIPFFLILIIEILFKILNLDTFVIFTLKFNALMFSMIIGYSIYVFFVGITQRPSTAVAILGVLGALLITVNQIKINFTGEPVYFSDINFISKINGIFTMVSRDVVSYIIKYLFVIIIFISIFFLIIKLIRKNETKITKVKTRIIMISSCIVVLTILFVPNKYTKDTFLKIFFNINDYKDYASYTTNLSYYNSHSLLAGMYGILLNNRFEEPQEYNEQVLDKVLEIADKQKNNNTWGKPNIIVLFSESFWDIDKQNNVKFGQKVAPNIKKLKEKGKVIETLSCSYGGMSENVAFELLTGGSLNYFTRGYIPIMSLYKRENSENIPSLVKELRKNNYKSKIVFGEDYYSSEKSMKKIGFDEYTNLSNEENQGYITDKYITDVIISELENKKTDEKIFYMAETIQNHMPYNIDKYLTYDISIKESNLSKEENDAILSYAQGIYDADEQLNRLYEYIKEYKEPTILVFLGDHLPYLYTKNGDNVLESLSYFNTENEIENLYRKYNTQTLILSNYDIDISNIPENLSNNLLFTYIANQLDIKLSSYYKWLYSTIDDLPASNLDVSLDSNGTKYNTQEMNSNMQRMYKLRENMQYKFFIKATE